MYHSYLDPKPFTLLHLVNAIGWALFFGLIVFGFLTGISKANSSPDNTELIEFRYRIIVGAISALAILLINL